MARVSESDSVATRELCVWGLKLLVSEALSYCV